MASITFLYIQIFYDQEVGSKNNHPHEILSKEAHFILVAYVWIYKFKLEILINMFCMYNIMFSHKFTQK